MSDTIITSIITSVTGFIGAVIGGVITYRGVRLQLKEDNLKQRLADEKNAKNTIRAIFRFLKPEMHHNYAFIGIEEGVDFIATLCSKLKFDEYEKLKYKIVESPSRLGELLIKQYDLFNDLAVIPNNKNNENRIKTINEITENKIELEKEFNKYEALI